MTSIISIKQKIFVRRDIDRYRLVIGLWQNERSFDLDIHFLNWARIGILFVLLSRFKMSTI